MAELSGVKINEITLNPRYFALKCKSTKKAAGTVKRLKKFIQRQFNTKDPVYVSESLNTKIWSRGNNKSISRIRVRVERGPCMVNPEKSCVRLSLVEVNTFKHLNDAAIDE